MNRKQVRMYLLHTGHNKCEKCGKEHKNILAKDDNINVVINLSVIK